MDSSIVFFYGADWRKDIYLLTFMSFREVKVRECVWQVYRS